MHSISAIRICCNINNTKLQLLASLNIDIYTVCNGQIETHDCVCALQCLLHYHPSVLPHIMVWAGQWSLRWVRGVTYCRHAAQYSAPSHCLESCPIHYVCWQNTISAQTRFLRGSRREVITGSDCINRISVWRKQSQINVASPDCPDC